MVPCNPAKAVNDGCGCKWMNKRPILELSHDFDEKSIYVVSCLSFN